MLCIVFFCVQQISAQIKDQDTPIQSDLQEQESFIVTIDENGVLNKTSYESLNIPNFKVVDNTIQLNIDGQIYNIPLDASYANPVHIRAFELKGNNLILGFSDNSRFEVDLSDLVFTQKAATGAFSTTSNVTSNAPGDLATDDYVFGSSQLDDNGMVTNQLRMLFDKSKGAFRAGHAQGTEFDDANRGIRSGAFGLNNIANGTNSFSAGKGNTASNDAAVAFGSSNVASGKKTFVTGANNTASGNNSYVLGSNSMSTEKGSGSLGDNNQTSGANATSIGVGLKTESAGQLSAGVYNTAALASNPTDPTIDTDRLFVIGNGDSDASRSDALLMLKNANTTLNGTLTIREGGTGNAYTLPGNDGTNGQVMTTDGSGNVTWAAAGGGGGGGCDAYGDGSAGNVTIAANTNWNSSPPTNGNYMFDNLTINAGVTLTVPSGTKIYCSGNFVNNGTITVSFGVPRSRWFGNADQGFPTSAGDTYSQRIAYGSESFRGMLDYGPKGGGNGTQGSFTGADLYGGAGGGTLMIFAQTGFTNAGTIQALGEAGALTPGTQDRPGTGGGGGGFVFVGCDANINNTGTISVRGGNGSNAGSTSDGEGGGGGGGGLIHLMSPSANAVMGTLTITGGSGGAGDAPVDPNSFNDGGNGGAGAGNGGLGGVTFFGPTPAEDGSSGVLLRSQIAVPCSILD